MYSSEIMDMLKSIESHPKVKKFLIAPHVVVIHDGRGFGIHENWSMQDNGECVVYSKTKKDIIPDIKEYMDQGWGLN